MSPAGTRRFAWTLAVFAIVVQIAGRMVAATAQGFSTSDLFIVAVAFAFATVGLLVATRLPGNAIGWTFLGVAVATSLAVAARAFVVKALQDDGEVSTLVGAAAAYADVSWVPFILIPATFLLLLFPDGHLPSRRWRFVAWCAGAGILGTFVADGAGPEPIADFPTVRNPFAIDSPILEALGGLSWLLLLIGVAGSASSLVVRFRRADRVQRQQIKWLATAGAIVAVTLPIVVPFYETLGSGVANGIIMFAVLGLPAAAGIAILRHRLYDIDVVINRTLVYAALTALLAGTYLGSILLLPLVLSAITADNGLAIAGSTLAVAALFQPLRARVQALVDRHFYRRKYDAARTLERFALHLRDEVDLDTVAAELRAVVANTMQPAHVSLWLRAGWR